MTCTPLAQARSVSSPSVCELAQLRLVRWHRPSRPGEPIAERKADVILAHDVADVVEDARTSGFLCCDEHPLGEQRAAAGDDADQAFPDEGQVLASDTPAWIVK